MTTYRALKASQGATDPEAGSLVNEVIDAAKARRPDWNDLYLLEQALLVFRTGESLKRFAWSLRHEYQSSVTEREYKAYEASKPPLPDDAEPRLKADLLALQGELHRQDANQRALSRIRTSLTLLSLVVGIVVVCAFEIQEGREARNAKPTASESAKDPENVLFDVFAVGVMGGCFSTLLRVQSFKVTGFDSFNRLNVFWNRLMIILSPLIGGVGAVILFVIIKSEIVSLPLFPKFDQLKLPPDADYLDTIFHCLINDPLTAAKLYLTCFLAGFSERLVPDTLSRLTAMAQQQEKHAPQFADSALPHSAATTAH